MDHAASILLLVLAMVKSAKNFVQLRTTRKSSLQVVHPAEVEVVAAEDRIA